MRFRRKPEPIKFTGWFIDTEHNEFTRQTRYWIRHTAPEWAGRFVPPPSPSPVGPFDTFEDADHALKEMVGWKTVKTTHPLRQS